MRPNDWPPGKYRVIYADPPWNWRAYSSKGEGRSAKNHYGVMDLDAIKGLPVSELAAENSALLMWITDPFLEMGFDVIKSWGFQYKTVCFHWSKLRKPFKIHNSFDNRFYCDVDQGEKSPFAIGNGYYTRANPEMCLLATVGRPARVHMDVRRLIVSPRREHSRKPDEAYNRIERLFSGPYVELFSRTKREGWDSWGMETGKFAEGHQS